MHILAVTFVVFLGNKFSIYYTEPSISHREVWQNPINYQRRFVHDYASFFLKYGSV